MSQGSTRSRPSSSSPNKQRYQRPPALQSRTLPPIHTAGRTGAGQDGASLTARTQGLSNRPTPASWTPPDQRTSRPIGVQNLLNPAGEDKSTPSRRRNAEHLDSPPRPPPLAPSSHASTPSTSATALGKRSSAHVSLPSITPPLMNVHPQAQGGTMTPISPSSYGLVSVTNNLPSGTMDAKQSPFVLPRDHNTNAAYGASYPPETVLLPTTSAKPYSSSLPLPRSPRQHMREYAEEKEQHRPDRDLYQDMMARRRGSQESLTYPRSVLDHTGGIGNLPQPPTNRSDSPSTVYSSYSQAIHTPPPAAPPTATAGQPTSFFGSQFANPGAVPTLPQMNYGVKAFDVPVSGATGHSQYQMMTLETDQGPIQVPVDVQAASKVADEKRKRNATASHRFRQRRKEKERETSQNIAQLEQQIKEMAEEKEYYRAERDYFQDVATRNRIPIPPRQASPRRQPNISLGGAKMQATSPQHGPEGNGRGGRNTRRRTSTYVPPQGPAPQAPEGLPSLPQLVRPPNMGPYNPPTPR